jgi:hypothetical protein
MHFIIDSSSQKNIVSVEVIKRLDFPTTPHPHQYTIRWLRQGSDLRISQHCLVDYDIKPFKDEALCDVSHLEFCVFLLGQPYLWKRHVAYESRPHSVIITLDRKLYRITEVVPSTAISLISSKQWTKFISQIKKFVFFMIHTQIEQKVAAKSMAFATGLSTEQKKVDNVMEEYKYIFSSPTRVPLHC